MKTLSLSRATAIVAVSALATTGLTGLPASTATAASSSGQITYSIGEPSGPAALASLEANIKLFEKQSGVSVKIQIQPGSTTDATLDVQLESGDGPDVFWWGTGPGYAGVLAKAGLLYNLTGEYATQHYPIYKWALPGVTFGGKLLGVPDQIEEQAFFYNKAIFAKLGISLPKNLADFEKDLATIKAAGILPISEGDQQGFEGSWLLSMSLSSLLGSTEENKLAFGTGDWDTTSVASAMGIWRTFIQKGWMSPDATSISDADAGATFYAGKAAMYPTGSWILQNDLPSIAKFPVGEFAFPGYNNSGIYSQDLGNGYFMSAKSKDPAAARCKLMDFLVSQNTGKWELDQYFIPAFPVSTSGVTSPLFKEVIANTSKFAKGNQSGNGALLDNTETAVFLQDMHNGMQGVLNGTVTPANLAKTLQAAPRPASSNALK